MSRLIPRLCLIGIAYVLASHVALCQRQMERLGRGLVAVKSSGTQVYVGWRLLGNDPQDLAFNLYRSANGAAAVKLNASPLTATTDYLDTPSNPTTTSYSYSVKPVLNGVEVPDIWANPLSASATLPASAMTRQYVPVPLQPTPDDAGAGVSYKVKFCWVGDLDGDGEFDFVVDRYNPSIDARQWLQAYKRDGTLLWQMNMGPNSVYHYNIEPGSSTIGIGHGDNVTVYDMDGDGKAEVIVRTSNGVVFGNGAVQSGGASDNVQFLSIVNGLTGAELARATIPNPLLADGPMNGHMGILYLDGQRPSVILAAKNRDANNAFHGTITAWDWRSGVLTQRWSWVDSGAIHAPEGHQIRIADVENDGKDEFVDIGYVLDDTGTQKFNLSEVVHGDRFHLTDIDPDRPGLENFIIQQNNGSGLATSCYDAGSGAIIKKGYAGGVVDVGRGVVADIDSTQKGCEYFSTQAGIFNSKGTQIYASQPFPPEAIWWDADLSREFVATVGSTAEAPAISKFNPSDPANLSRVYTIYNETPPGVYQAYGGRPAFWGDILGDWREELLCVANDNSELRIYTPKTASTTRIYTLMHNPQYRCQQTTKGYAQASYVDYYLGTGMTIPQPPPMVDSRLAWRGGAGSTTWDVGATSSWQENGATSTFANGDSVRFDIGGNNATTVVLGGTVQPSAVTVYSPKNYTFDGTNGSFAGSMTLMKAGSASMSLTGTHSHSGKTTVWDGAFILNGTLSQSPLTVWGGTWGGASAAGASGGRVAGTGTFNQPATIAYRGGVTPGSGMGNAGTLHFDGGLTAQDGSYFAMDLSNDPTGGTSPSDKIVITGNLSLNGKVGLVIKSLSGPLAPGSYTLITYTGTLTGNVSNLSVSVPSGTAYSIAASAGAVTLTVPVTRSPASVVWRGTSGSWDLSSIQNWLKGGAADVFVSGDAVSFDAAGAASPTVTLGTSLPVASMTVNSATDYAFVGTGSISGAGGITKSGTGTLTLSTLNDFTGPMILNGGVVAIDSLGDAGSPSSIGAASSAASNLVLNGGTLRLTGLQTNTNRSLTLGASGGGLEVVSASSSMQISGAVTGSGGLTKSGNGTLILASANSYTGGTTIQGGTVYLAGATANSSGLGSGAITFSNGTLTMANVQASETAAWNMVVPSGATGRLNADGRCSLTGSLSGDGTFTYYSPYVRSDLKGNWSAFTGQINLATDADGSEMRVSNTFGFGTAALNLGANSYLYLNVTNSSPTLNIGELTGDGTSGLSGGPTAGSTVTWRIGGRNTNATYAGLIQNGTGTTAITKSGSGIWTLTGACTHTGATTVSAGTLRINGTTSGSAVTVQTGAAIGGSGSVTGNVTVQAGALIEHGALGSVPLAVTGNLTFGSTAIVRPVEGIAIAPGTYSLITYTGTLSGSPSLSWQAPVGSNLAATFDTSVSGVVKMILSEPPGVANLVWTGTSGFNWDSTSANWTNGTATSAFTNGSSVSFTDLGIATSPINVALDVEPVAFHFDSTKNYSLGGGGRITGATSLEKTGVGTLTLTSANTYTGGTTLSGGTLVITNAGALGTGSVLLAGGTWATGALTPTNPIVVSSNSTISGGSGSGAHGIKAVTGDHILTLTATNVFDLEGSLTGFSGTILLNGTGSFRLNGSAGSPTASFDLGTRSLGARSGSAFSLGSLTGASGSSLGGANGYTSPVTYTIGGNHQSTTFNGIITNGNLTTSASNITHLVKSGTGSLTLAGVNTYTGSTTVSSGALLVTGSLANSSTSIATSGTLGGSGSLGGNVVCDGTLSPGLEVGTLSLNAGLVLASSSVLRFDLGSTSDRVLVNGNVTLAGTLNVTAAPGFGPGTYNLISYSGTLTDETGLSIGTLPDGFEATVSTSVAGQVQLVVTAILTPFEEWQIANFGSVSSPNAASNADPDGDGSSNLTEFRLGLDPVSGASSFTASGARSPGGFTLTWPSAAGLSFEVQRSTSLEGPWTVISTVVGAGSFTDPSPPTGRAFYRVVLLP